MEVLFAPVLHKSEPENAPAVNTELPQLLTTEIVGAVGIVLGAELALATTLVQPLPAVCVTE